MDAEEPDLPIAARTRSSLVKRGAPSQSNAETSRKKPRPSLDDMNADTLRGEPSCSSMPVVETVMDDNDASDDAEKPSADSTPPQERQPDISFNELPEELQDKLSGETIRVSGRSYDVHRKDDGTFAFVSDDMAREELDVQAVYDHFNRFDSNRYNDLVEIVNDKWEGNELMVRVKLGTGDHEWMPAKHVKSDQPMMLAKHVMDHPVDRVRSGQWQSWARTTVKAIDRTMHHASDATMLWFVGRFIY